MLGLDLTTVSDGSLPPVTVGDISLTAQPGVAYDEATGKITIRPAISITALAVSLNVQPTTGPQYYITATADVIADFTLVFAVDPYLAMTLDVAASSFVLSYAIPNVDASSDSGTLTAILLEGMMNSGFQLSVDQQATVLGLLAPTVNTGIQKVVCDFLAVKCRVA